MKKVSLLILVSLILLLSFASCTLLDELLGTTPAECEHEWTEATCAAPKTCTKCNATEGEAAAHNWAAATCTAPKTCKTCNKTEGAPNGHTEVTLEAVDPTCTSTGLTEGKKCSVCNTVTKEQTTVAKLAHTEVDVPGTAADCTTAGLTDGKQCSVCQTWTVPQQTIPAGNHALSPIPGKAPTCTEDGLTEGKECLECHEIIVPQEPIPATGHDYDEEETEPTCTEAGFTKYTCDCGHTYTEPGEAALGHYTEGAVAMKENDHPATCMAPGSYDMVTRCLECNEIAHTEHFTINQLEHKFVNYTHDEGSEKCGVDGTKSAYCAFECGTKSTVTDEGTALTHQMPTDTLCGEEWTCERGCGHKETLEHDYAPATCQTLATCKKCQATTGDFAAHIDGEPTTVTTTLPTCTDEGIAFNVTKCTVCRVETKREPADNIPALGHNMLPATCDDPSTCANGCGKTEGEAIATHTPVATVSEGSNVGNGYVVYSCTTCGDTFTTDKALIYTGADKGDLFFTKNGDPTVSIEDGAYKFMAGAERSQIMIYGPSNDINHANAIKNFGEGAFGVYAFKLKAGTITEELRVIVMSARNNPNWDKNGAWNGNSVDILAVRPNGNGTFDIYGKSITSNVFATVTGDEWVNVEMFLQMADNGLKISYYINGQFCNTYTLDFAKNSAGQAIKNLDINCFYMCGWTAAGTGFALDNIYFGAQTSSEWLFDEHKHVWADATCEEAKHCTACGLVDETAPAFGHTNATRNENVVAPDCVNAGSHDVVTYCSTCSKVLGTEHVVDAATGHDLDENNICKVCGVDLHECNLVAAETVDPTCTEGGYTVYRCDHANCNKHENRDFTDPTGHTMQAATCTAPKTCSACGHTEGAALGHSYTAPSCAAAETCSVCGATKGQPNANAHQLTANYTGSTLTYNCSVCGYSFVVETFDYSDGTNYNGMHANASQNNTVYTTNGSNYPVQKDGYLEFIRTDAEAGAQKQLQMWLPSANGGTNKFSGFTAASNSIGYLAFKIDAKTDVNFEMKLVDHRVDSVNGESIRWGDQWAINDPVFRVLPAENGVARLVGFNSTLLASATVDENGFTGWVDVAIQIVLDPNTDKVIAHYYINGAYVATSSRDLTTHTDAIQAVYINFNSKAAGCGYRIDNLTFGYSAHKHDLVPTVANGVLGYTCDCGTDFIIDSEVREWNGDGSDSAMKNVPNGNVELTTNAQGQYEYIFKPYTDTAPDFSASGTQSGDGWYEYDGKGYAGGQLQMWMPSNNRDTNTLTGFSCENDSVGVISFNVKTNLSRHPDWDTSLTFSVGKPRNADDWSSSGGWDTSSINIFTIEEYQASGIVVKGGLNGTNLNLTTIPVTEDGWSEWFNVMIVIEMTKEEYINVYYYINGALLGTDSRDLNNPGGYRTLNPKKIEALQISGWTYVPNTGIVFDDFYFGYSANGHNTLDGHVHNITETTCGEKSTCSCGWTGYTVAHTFATACAPACSVCGLANEHAATHTNLVATGNADGVSYVCSDCNYCYTVKGENLHTLGDASDATTAGTYTKTYTGTYLSMINNGSDTNAQHQFWFPGQTESPEFADCKNANGSTVFLSFSINAKDHHNTGIEFKFNANRNQPDAGNFWSDSSVGVFKIKPWTEGATTVALTGYNGADLGTIAINGTDGWTGWIDVVVVMHLNTDNTVTVEYYLNGSLFKTLHADMVIHTNEVNSLYINGRTNGAGQGYELKDLFFGYTNEAMTEVKAPFYKSEIAAENVQSETLKTIVASKIKQCDQTSAPNVEGGTPVYVIAEGKDGEDVEALYISRTYAWTTETVHFTEFRFAVNGENKSGPATVGFSFDYKINGTVETNDRYTFTDLEGNTFSADAYVQVKTAADHPLAGDNYPELSGTDLILDGEWHTMTYTFEEPIVLIDFLINLYQFQGEMLIANIQVNTVG